MQAFYNFQATSKVGWIFSYRGDFGVDLFFVLSGFVMYITAKKPSVNWWSFFVRRLMRVVPAYWFFSLILVVLVLWVPDTFPNNKFTALSLTKSFLFIPHHNPAGIGVRPLLTVGWTLNYEILFYILFSACILLTKRYAALLCGFLIIIFLLVFIKQDDVLFHIIKSPLMLLFILGLLVGWANEKFNLLEKQSVFLGGLSLFLALFFLSGMYGYGQMHKAVAATLVMIGFISLNNYFNENNIIIKFLINLGNSSYSTYLCHAILIRLFLGAFGSGLNLLQEVMVLFLLTICTYFLSRYSFFFIENANLVSTIRKKLMNLNLNDTKALANKSKA